MNETLLGILLFVGITLIALLGIQVIFALIRFISKILMYLKDGFEQLIEIVQAFVWTQAWYALILVILLLWVLHRLSRIYLLAWFIKHF